MKKLSYIILFVIFCVTCFTGCKKPYAPPAIKVDNKFLVIDGVLVNSIDSPSVFILSRTTRLTDSTTSSSPEPGAQVSVEASTGEIFNFQEQPNGIYRADRILLNTSNKYRLKVVTSSGSQYASDFVDVKQTPPIDSLEWEQQNDVHIYLDSHDPLNNTKYYRWDFAETWQYVSLLDAELSQDNGILFYVDATNQTHTCWHTTTSTELLLGSTIALSEDVINKAPIAIVPQNDAIGHDPNNFFAYDYPDPDYDPYYFGGSTALVIARKSCVDCRLKGVNQKPSYC